MKEKRNVLLHNLKQSCLVVCVLLIGGLGVVSCSKEDSKPLPETPERTVFMYLPWSSDLLSFFKTNIADFEKSIEKNGLYNSRLVVFLSTSLAEATLFEITYEKGKCVRNTLKEYSNPAITTEEGIVSILNDVKLFAPSSNYGIIIGCHGTGWIPVSQTRLRSTDQKMHWEYGDKPRTRYFGGYTTDCQTDVITLANGIHKAGIKMEYILFDDCYMSSIEAIYDLKDVTDYFIACPTEILIDGMPYAKIASYLLGNVDYEAIRNAFVEHYASGTIAVTVCSELDRLATVMKEINRNYEFESSLESLIQPMDGYSPGLFFDYGDYVAKLCKNENLLKEFEEQLERAVPSNYKGHCGRYPTNRKGSQPISTYSGVTTSDPSRHSLSSTKTQTAWYKATH